ncbi:PTS cellobiose transporter subunit IIB [Bacillus sp. FJAT-27916]|nr:PTS sugar transporter subunit IIB [Bacillus sp. FJAT-27916]KMY46446.1 PTS cellobiose transporter subunit IIB [Bacillus sp. FJAT-27916]
MLVCAAGMSTSLLVTKMQKSAEKQGIQADIFAISAQEIDIIIEQKNVDVLLLGPQVKYMQNQIESKLAGRNIPVAAINMQDYGMMNGEKVLDQALHLIENR